MFIGKTILDHQALISIGSRLFGTKKTHDNDLIATQYMTNDSLNEYEALRLKKEFAGLLYYTFAWPMPVSVYYQYATPKLNVVIKSIEDGQHNFGYICFFTGCLLDWRDYCLDEDKPKEFRAYIKNKLSQDGYSLLFKETKTLPVR